MINSVRFATGFALITCAAWISVGRAQAPRDSQGSPAVTFQVEVDYVDVDVVVTDQQGNFVGGLTRALCRGRRLSRPICCGRIGALARSK